MLKLVRPILQSPVRLLYASWGFVFICYILFPVKFNEAWSTKTILFIFGFFFLFTLGYLLGKQFIVDLYNSSSRPKAHSFQERPIVRFRQEKLTANQNFYLNRISFKLNRFVITIALFGLIGSCLLAGDFLFLRGIDYSRGLSAAREVMQQTVIDRGGIPAGRPLSIVGRILAGFCPVAVLVSVLRLEYLRSRTLFFVIVSLVFQIFTDVLSGGRNSIFMTLLLLISGMIVRMNRRRLVLSAKKKIFRKVKKWLPVLAVSFVVYALFIFIEREGLRGRTLVEAYENMETAWRLSFLFDIRAFGDGESILHKTTLAFTYLGLYIIHSLNEINLLISQTPHLFPIYGLHSFYLPALLANRIGIISSEILLNASNSIERSGVYFTALGSLYVDFGYWFSFIVFLALGFITGISWKLFRLGHGLCSELICAYLLLAIVISPFYLSVTTGNGFQILSALAVSALIVSKLRLDIIL